MTEKPKCASLNEALFEFQARFEGVPKNRTNTFTNSKYASLDDVVKYTKPLLAELDLLFVHFVQVDTSRDPAVQWLNTTLFHLPSGEYRESKMLLPGIDNPQMVGSGMTYYKRYNECAILNIVETDDDDGNSAVVPPAPAMTEKQHSEILDYMNETATELGDQDTEGTLLHHIYTAFNVDSIEGLSSRQASIIVKMLKEKYRRQQAGEPVKGKKK